MQYIGMLLLRQLMENPVLFHSSLFFLARNVSPIVMAATTPTALTVSGTPTPVSFIPLSTPYPSKDGCSGYIYEQVDGHFIAWDPFYGASLDTKARSCFPSEVSSWWSQAAETSIFTALGPTFVCPGAYSAVQTVVIASDTQKVFCCPL